MNFLEIYFFVSSGVLSAESLFIRIHCLYFTFMKRAISLDGLEAIVQKFETML